MNLKFVCSAMLAIGLASCDDSSNSLGIYTDSDNISAEYAIFNTYTRSIAADSVLSKSNTCYLGCITDPETRTQVKAEFLTQLITLDDYMFPDYSLLIKNEQGEIEADSAELELLYYNYYGDYNNPMKIRVYELDSTNVVKEDTAYYSNINLAQFINPRNPSPIATQVVTAKDFSETDDTYQTINIRLPKKYGTDIIRKYFEHKEFFKSPYAFIRHVCPGFYLNYSGGNELMLHLSISQLKVFFKYHDEDLKKDTIGYTSFPATPEVLQYSSFNNDDLSTLIAEKDWTYLKTPAGIFTEMTLPIDEIYDGHDQDSISQAKITFYRYNNTFKESHLGIPSTILMLRKSELYSFFENKKINDGNTSYVATLNTSYNSYTFSNIGNLIAYCKNERASKAKAENLSIEEWSRLNPDWNKVVLIPVEISMDDNNNVTRVTNDMSLNSTRLYGGDKDPITIQVIYSSFK